jgi:hypothetical protein
VYGFATENRLGITRLARCVCVKSGPSISSGGSGRLQMRAIGSPRQCELRAQLAEMRSQRDAWQALPSVLPGRA